MPNPVRIDFVSSSAYLIECPHCKAATFLEEEEKKWDKWFTTTFLNPVKAPDQKFVDKHKVLGNWAMGATKMCTRCRMTFSVRIAHVGETGYTISVSKNPMPDLSPPGKQPRAKLERVTVFYDSDAKTYTVHAGGVRYRLMKNGKLKPLSKKALDKKKNRNKKTS